MRTAALTCRTAMTILTAAAAFHLCSLKWSDDKDVPASPQMWFRAVDWDNPTDKQLCLSMFHETDSYRKGSANRRANRGASARISGNPSGGGCVRHGGQGNRRSHLHEHPSLSGATSGRQDGRHMHFGKIPRASASVRAHHARRCVCTAAWASAYWRRHRRSTRPHAVNFYRHNDFEPYSEFHDENGTFAVLRRNISVR